MITKLTWKKCPSTTRTGKCFYYCESMRLTVMLSFLTGKWVIYGFCDKYFDTAKKAMAYVQKHLDYNTNDEREVAP